MTIWKNTFGKMPLIGIMRGVIPAHAIQVVTPIIEAGFRVVEVPLNLLYDGGWSLFAVGQR